MNILIVEDEPKTARFIQKGLSESGFQCEIAIDGLEALHYCSERKFACIVLDIQIPKLNGWSVLASIRTTDKQIPILILTAQSDLDDKVKGFEAGADDYLVKPFAFSELLARIRALTRRKVQSISNEMHIADLNIDFLKGKVSRSEQTIHLTPKEFALLRFLAEHQGETLSRTIISEKVWGMHFDSGTNVVDVAMRRLRDKIDRTFNPKLLHTVRGMGYKLCLTTEV